MQPGENIGRGRARKSESERAATVAMLRFRHSAAGSGVSRRGHIRPGGQIVVQYDPARLSPSADTAMASRDIVCHVRFSPGDQRHSGAVLDTGAAKPRGAEFEVQVPSAATNLEIWFESRGPSGTIGWDSRHGQNYSFIVIGDGLPVPEPSVALRAEALVSPSKIRVVEDAATKEATASGGTGKRLRTGLVVRAHVDEPETDTWADIHIFDATGELIHTGSVLLQRRESAADGALFVWEDDVFQGSGGGSGIGVWSRPDAQTIQYRLYCKAQRPVFEAQAPVFTDGVLHEFEVPADEDASRN
jgi:hypothetical protein